MYNHEVYCCLTGSLDPPIDVMIAAGSTPTSSLLVSWTPPGSYYDKMIVGCDNNTDKKNVSKGTDSTECTGLAAGTLYAVVVSTALDNDAVVASAPTVLGITGRSSMVVTWLGVTTVIMVTSRSYSYIAGRD